MTTSTLALYIAHLFNLKMSPRTISSYLSAISYLHKVQSLPDPAKHFIIQKLVAGAYRLRPSVDMRLPITAPILTKIIHAAQVCLSGYNKTLFSAMFAFAFYTYARVGELTDAGPSSSKNALQLKDVSVLTKQNQPMAVKVSFSKFKHNWSGQTHLISFSATGCSPCPVALFISYLRHRGPHPGNLFCNASSQPVTRHNFDTHLRRCLSFCGLSSENYKGHSFRIGKASWDAQRGVPDSQIRLRGRWKSDAFRKYIRVDTS